LEPAAQKYGRQKEKALARNWEISNRVNGVKSVFWNNTNLNVGSC
jgi:hypothetical protein